MEDLVVIHLSFGSQPLLVAGQKILLFLPEVAGLVLASDGDHVDILPFELYQKVVSIAKPIVLIHKNGLVLFFFLDGEDDSFVHPEQLRQALWVVLVGTMLVVLIPNPQGSESCEVVIIKGRLILMPVLDNNESVPQVSAFPIEGLRAVVVLVG